MRFFTSSSSRQGLAWALGLAVTLGLGLEALARVAVYGISRTEKRIVSEAAEARQLKAAGPDGTPVLLLAGNSLLLSDIDLAELRAQLAGVATVARYTVENTAYLDWYYGLKRLHDEGSRPAAVALMLTLDHLNMNSVRGEYFANRLMAARDLPGVMEDAGLDRTQGANLWLAHYSAWLGTKTEMRKLAMGRLLPFSGAVLAQVPSPAPPLPAPDALLEKVTARLRRYRELYARDSTRVCLITPPIARDTAQRRAWLSEAARRAGVELLDPVPPTEYPPTLYTDGLHFGEQAQHDFTHRLSAALRQSRVLGRIQVRTR